MLYFADANGTTEIEQEATILNDIPHSYGSDWENDVGGHWHECSCGDKKDVAAHIPGVAVTENTPQTCTICGYIITPATGHITHTPDTTQWYSDGINHWRKCVGCNEIMNVTAHGGGTATCEDKAHCEICNAEYGNLASHAYGNWIDHDDTQHKHTCTVCEKHTEYEKHSYDSGVITTAPTRLADGEMTFTCLDCGKNKVENISRLIEHLYNQKVATATHLKTAATCTQTAVYYKSCIYGERGTETFEHGKFASHTLSHHQETVATCMTAGNVEHWTCSVCDNYFSDASGTTEITQAQTAVNALGHDFVFTRTVAPDFEAQSDGYDLYTCSHDTGHTEQRNIVEWETLTPKVTINVTGGTIQGQTETAVTVQKASQIDLLFALEKNLK